MPMPLIIAKQIGGKKKKKPTKKGGK